MSQIGNSIKSQPSAGKYPNHGKQNQAETSALPKIQNYLKSDINPNGGAT